MTRPLSEAVAVRAFGMMIVAGWPAITRSVVLPATKGLLIVL